MLLLEIIAGTNKKIVKKTDEFWAQYNVPKLNFFPRYSNNWYSDMTKFYGGDALGDDPSWEALKPIRQKIERLTKVDYGAENSNGWFLVTPGVVNFDISRFSGSNNRRRNTPMDKEHKKSDGEIPILAGELTFGRILDMQKVLKTLVKVKPATASYKIVGDERVRGMTVQQVIDGAAEKHSHVRAFTPTVQSLTMFHGTSKKRADQILSSGLKPSVRGSMYFDMIPGYSVHNVYLSMSPGAAANYATREAINDKSEAAILEVELTPMMVMKLLPDEDSMHWFKYLDPKHQNALLAKFPILKEIWSHDGKEFDVHIKNMNHKERKFNLDWLYEKSEYRGDDEFRPHAMATLKKHGYTRETIGALENALYIEIMQTFIRASASKSLKKTNTAAYPGMIPAKQIKLLKTWKLEGSKIKPDSSNAEYNAASEKQEKTVKYAK